MNNPKEIKVAFNSNGSVRWATHQIKNHPFSEPGTLFIEAPTSCSACNEEFDCKVCGYKEDNSIKRLIEFLRNMEDQRADYPKNIADEIEKEFL